MKKNTIQFVRSLVLLPFLATSSPFAILQAFHAPIQNNMGKGIVVSIDVNKQHADQIDAYFAQRDMPLEGYGAKFIAEAEKNNLDWRLLPAIAIKESTAGKFACGHNPFGWGSCKIKFSTWDKAIETVATNLGGNNPATAEYYKGTTREKLYSYNGSVIPTYTGEILRFMDAIDSQEV